jgi:peptide/nickel transport system substrate-binding protein
MSLQRFVTTILGLAVIVPGVALAATPANTLVIAKNIDDIITLDPGEAYEESGGEIITNVYDRLIRFEATDVKSLVGGVAESWSVSPDGRTFTFKIRPGLKFQSGNPVTAEDGAFSLQRVILLDKTPGFLLTQFGWTKDNVAQNIKATDTSTLVLTLPTDFAPSLVLNVISSTIGAVVDKKVALEHAAGDDLGNGWLKNHSAGSGAFNLRSWTPNESVVLEANPDFHLGAPKLARVVVRHVPEAAAQRLLLEKGDVDIARNLTADQVNGLNLGELTILPQGSADSFYVALNQSEPHLANPKVREAMRWAIDYQGMVDSFLKGQFTIHQSFLPSSFWASIADNPYKFDIAKAKALLAEAGYPSGFDISMDAFNSEPWSSIAQSIQATMNQAGIRISLLPAEQKQVWTKFRARQHQMLLIKWSPDYLDPHSNSDTFCRNTDNSDTSKSRTVAWRNHWLIPELSKQSDAASREKDTAKRESEYVALQKALLADSPYLFMFEPVYEIALRKNVKDFVVGPYWDLVFYRLASK